MLRLQSIISFLVGGLLAASPAYADAGTGLTQETVEERLHRIDEFVWGGGCS